MKSILRQSSKPQKQAVAVVVVDNNEPTLISRKSNLNLTSTSINSNNNNNNNNNNNLTSSMSKISEQKAQRLKHYESMNSFEHQNNGGNLALMNSLQDNELNDILNNVNDYINLSLNKVNKYDNLISVSWTDINANQNTNWNKRARKNTIQDVNQFDDKLSISSSSTTMNQNEFIMTITSINPIDFLQNGLRSGPFETAKLTAAEIEQNRTTQTTTASSKAKTDTKTVIKLKYLLELDLNTDYFDLNQVDEKGLIHAIRFKKKPKKWSIKDYDQVSIDLSITKDEPFRKVINNIINREKQLENNHQIKIDYLKLSKPKSYRYLNSKALFDRLLNSFSSVLKYEWPYYHNPANKENNLNDALENKSDQAPSALSTTHTVKTTTSIHSNPNAIKYPICEEFKTCISNDNQLKISFKWKGVKHKDLDIIILINIGVKYFNGEDERIQNKINESILEICNKFFENGGFFKPVNKLDLFQMEQICSWANKYLKINLNSLYLVPIGVHHWSISLHCLKLNLIKFLVWANSLNQSFIGVDAVVDLLNGGSNKNFSEMNAPNKFEAKQPMYNFFSTIHLGKSSLLVLLKSFQIFNSIFLSQIDEKSKLDDENLNYIDLILENILLELKLNANNQLISKITWSSEYTFDHFWSILLRLRFFMLNSKLNDSFNFFENVLPKIYYKYIGFHNLVLFTNKSQESTISPRTFVQNPLLIPLENAMRISFGSIILEEIYLPGQAKFEQPIEKDKTIFSKSNLINEILDYKSKHPEKSIQSSNTAGKVTVGTKTSKISLSSKE